MPPVPDKRSLKSGTILAREHEGELHRVMLLDEGFSWNEESLGAIATMRTTDPAQRSTRASADLLSSSVALPRVTCGRIVLRAACGAPEI
jgi:hypothetical protein